jgi:N-acetylglutamate synthase-like GNAT family acetyltransferase
MSQPMKFKKSDCIKLNQFYKRNKDKARAKPNDLMFTAINDNQEIVAVLRLLPYDGFLLLRSVLTAEPHRGKGIASQLIQQATAHYPERIYTLPTPDAFSLYQRLGFINVAPADIPAALVISYQRIRHSANAATVMVLDKRLG